METSTETQYGIRNSKPTFPQRDLLVVPHKDRDLTVSYPAFGPNTYSNNVSEMQKQYFHSEDVISFREPTISESISASAYNFGELAKPQIFNQRWLQLGKIVRTKEGVYTNTEITDKDQLQEMLDKAREVNGIYLIDDKIGFAPYESFSQGVQDVDTFTEGGLARVLEHTYEKVAKNLRKIASPKNYKKGVNVFGFDAFNEPVSRVAALVSDGGIGDDWLEVGGYFWGDSNGYAFGVLDRA